MDEDVYNCCLVGAAILLVCYIYTIEECGWLGLFVCAGTAINLLTIFLQAGKIKFLQIQWVKKIIKEKYYFIFITSGLTFFLSMVLSDEIMKIFFCILNFILLGVAMYLQVRLLHREKKEDARRYKIEIDLQRKKAEKEKQSLEAEKEKQSLEAEKRHREELERWRQLESEKRHREELERWRQLEAERKDREELERQIKEKEAIAVFEQITTGDMVVDSNIWLNRDYEALMDKLLTFCKKNKCRIFMPAEQLDELENMKIKKDKNIMAALAFRRIDRFQKANIISIEKVKPMARPRAYADPALINLFVSLVAEIGKKPCFISSDNALRIRLNGILKANGKEKNNYSIYTGAELQEYAESIRTHP